MLSMYPVLGMYLSELRAFLRCASCRFAALYFVPFYAGLVQAGRDTVGYALLSALFWFAYSLSIEVTNRLTDRVEDEVNRPERTQLCAQVGWQWLRRIEVVGWCTVVVFDMLWLRMDFNIVLVALLAAGFAFGIGYSRGPRFARARYIGLVVLNLVFGGVFLLGWAAAAPFAQPDGPPWRQLASFAPLAVIVGVFVVTLAGIKDITDRCGDLTVGYSSPFVDMLERQQAAWLKAIITTPFLLVLGFTLGGLLPLRLLALLTFAPLSALVVDAVLHADTTREQMVVRELFYNYWFIFSSTALLLFIPRAALLYAAIGALVYWTITTRWLHWVQPVTIMDIKHLVHTVAMRDRPRPASPNV
jgi:4-hydroxybenzoate polyprenyltransferase